MKETKKRVVGWKNIQLRSPINLGLLWYIALDYFHATPLIWGVVGTLFALHAVSWIYQMFTAEFVEL
mgnify:CR=1 FL=1